MLGKLQERSKIFGQTFYFNTIRKYVILFGTLFNDIVIFRQHDSGSPQAAIRVPLTYAPKDKMIVRIENDPNIDRPFSTLLPRMSFEMTGFQYDGTRKLQTVNKVAKQDASNPNLMKYQYNPVPYNIDFSLQIYVKNAEDGTRIVEQILPFFTPAWTTTINLIPELDITMDIPIIIKRVSQSDSYDGDFTKRRMLVWTLDFTLKGYFYGPVKKTGIIKIANTNFYFANTADIRDSVYNVDVAERVTVTPAMYANGTPLNTYGAANTATGGVPYTEIDAGEDFGYSVVIDSIEDLTGINDNET